MILLGRYGKYKSLTRTENISSHFDSLCSLKHEMWNSCLFAVCQITRSKWQLVQYWKSTQAPFASRCLLQMERWDKTVRHIDYMQQKCFTSFTVHKCKNNEIKTSFQTRYDDVCIPSSDLPVFAGSRVQLSLFNSPPWRQLSVLNERKDAHFASQ